MNGNSTPAGATNTSAQPAAALDTAALDTDVKARPLLRGWLHAGALVASLVAGPLLASRAPTPWTAAALSIYATSLVALFGVSAAFHRIRWSPAARRRMRRADHSTIFVAIAGTYTAIAGLAMSGWAQILVLTLVWVGSAVGITLRQVWLDAPKWAVALPYVVVGWTALVVVPQLLRGLRSGGFALVLAGGAIYSAGAVIYSLRRPDPAPGVFGYHELFHLCTVAGAALHFAAISLYALPRA